MWIKKYGMQKFLSDEDLARIPSCGLDLSPVVMESEIINTHEGIHKRSEFFSSMGNFSPAKKLIEIPGWGYHLNWSFNPSFRSGLPPIPDWDARKYLIMMLHGIYRYESYTYNTAIKVWRTYR